eukprot:5663977-Pyramimonas_sp.AAC.1
MCPYGLSLCLGSGDKCGRLGMIFRRLGRNSMPCWAVLDMSHDFCFSWPFWGPSGFGSSGARLGRLGAFAERLGSA